MPSASARIAVHSALFFVTSNEASEALSRKGVRGGLKKKQTFDTHMVSSS